MSTDWTDRRRELLIDLQTVGGEGRAEGEPLDRIPKGYYPVPEHVRALHPEVVLIVGPRGAGKTEIARVLTEAGLGSAVGRHAPALRLPAGEAQWRKGYPLGAEGFDLGGLGRFLAEIGSRVEAVRELWFTYLVRVLHDTLDEQARSALKRLLKLQGGAVQENHRAFLQAGDEPVLALDGLDQRLQKQDSFIFIAYDELDTLGGGDWSAMEASIRGLVAFWAAYARRWRRIRAKIFLRTDLFDRHATSGGADLAKLAAGRVELSWSDRDLYAMLLKRIANTSDALYEYVKGARPSARWSDDEALGHVPALDSWQEARPVVERMVGAYMGAGQKKGLVYRWLLDHVRDGRGRALPRPFVRLVEEAARIELSGPEPLRHPLLLHPGALRRGLDRVSEQHVAHARDEWPWLDSLKACFNGQLVPWDRERDVVRLLEGMKPAQEPEKRPPFEGRDLLDYLIEVGILRRRADGRIDAPDLFLAGLGLKRKGGVRRK
ncbi:MAG: hypothetical protein HY724_12080 [Candidatus Rokubacteria bacterium]|nr:hypothetical protein [Candidatus Rokubacteria bacterium]